MPGATRPAVTGAVADAPLDGLINKPGDFATNTGGAPVSVNGVGPVAVSEAEAAGTTYDAATGLVNTKSPIAPGSHTVFLSIFDQGDAIYDSAVFLDRLRFITESPTTCRPPEVPAPIPPPPPPPAPGAPPPPSNVFTVGSSITFGANGTATVTVVVPGPGVLTASDGSIAGTSRATAAQKKKAKKKALIATTKVTATKAGPVKIKIKPTAAGKKVLRSKGRLRVKVRLTFTPTNGAPRSQVKSVTLKVKKKKRRR